MNVSGIGSATVLLHAYGVDALQPTTGAAAPTARQTAGVTCDSDKDRDSSRISPMAQMLSKLQQLQAIDPTKFKQVLSDIAGKLQTLAQQQGQDAGGSWLNKLADRFQTAAQTGDPSSLQPHGHQHHHRRAA